MVYNLTPRDVLHTRLLLSTFSLPSELIDIILDTAAYWALIKCHRSDEVVVQAKALTPESNGHHTDSLRELSKGLSEYSEYKYLSLEVPAYEGTRVRMVSFRLRSSDQGRSNNATCRGTYNSTSSWFSIAIEPPTPTSECTNTAPESSQPHPPRWFLQSNVHGTRNRRVHGIEWTADEHALIPSAHDRESASDGNVNANETDLEKGATQAPPTGDPGDELGGRNETTGSGTGLGFCRAIVPGSTISVYACAQYSGWENHVWSVEAEVFCLL